MTFYNVEDFFMKKLWIAVSAATLIMSSHAFAEPISSGTPISIEDCSLLGSAVTINLSARVSGAYACNEAANAVTVATCHASGSRSAKTLTCVNYKDASDTAAPDDWNDPSCATGGIVVNGEPTNTYAGVGYTGYKAVSSGGGVGGINLQGDCNANSIGAEL